MLIVGRPDVDEGLDGRRAVSRVEWRVMDRITVDLADIEVFLDLGDTIRLDAIGNAPDLVGSPVVLIGQALPVGLFNQGDDAARCVRGAAVILAVGVAIISAEARMGGQGSGEWRC